ncbi:MAG: Fe-S-containing hydro-lyase [Chitinispirillaceae bacterium]|jgi:fumarate hydratase subunit beta|nr:Fe-S-containing hydro-lyase [Chitinispirillaceae bacterium]
MIEIETPLTKRTAGALAAGDEVLLSGVIYAARDAAHKRLSGLIDKGENLPVDLSGQVIYYCGPAPAKPDRPIGSAGPTTSSRMDLYTPRLLEKTGLLGMIGKGNRSGAVIEAMKKLGCVYFAATGGAGALIARCVVSAQIVCYEDLGPEAICRLEIKDMPLIVAIDSTGKNVYK